MENNLIPPFILCKAGLQVNGRAKIHTKDPTTEDHSITFPTTGFWIPLQLFGIFLYFSTMEPTEDDMLAGHDMYVMTPEKWNPHLDVYEQNEANIVDWEGNIKQPKDQIKVIIDELSGETDKGKHQISSVEMNEMDRVCAEKKQWSENLRHMKDGAAIRPYDEVGWHLSSVSSILVEALLVMKLEQRMC